MTEGQIPAEDILAIATTDDGDSIVIAIHDRATRCINITCSMHGTYCTDVLAPDTTVAETERLRAAAAEGAARYAADHRTPRVASPGASHDC